MSKTVLFFDLFFTLVRPVYSEQLNENDILNIPVDQWEAVAEDSQLYFRRATGIVKSLNKIIDEIVDCGNFSLTQEMKNKLLQLRVNRMKSALGNVDNVILDTLLELKEKNLELCIISNADEIDKLGWKDSPLFNIFNLAIFSCDVGVIKPNPLIYEIAMNKMNVEPQNSYFIGDGGSDELYGAKRVGMKTILTEYLLEREENKLIELLRYADYHIKDFCEIKKYFT